MTVEQPVDLRLSTVTSTSLLSGLKSPDNHSIWQEFVERYRPTIVGYARKTFGLSAADAEDATQETLNAFFEAYQKGAYDPEKGRLRNWLFGIASRQLKNFVRQKARGPEVGVPDASTGTAFLARIPDDDRLEEKWIQEWRRGVYRQCFEEVRRQLDVKTIEAYVNYAERGVAAENVAAELSMTTNAVYLAKHIVLRRIREMVPKMEEIW